ncbi:MAG TPA: RHS repeat-associated core domain-containing protein [Gemmatimonadaceae bacterium]|nr:RHS repeat-associated core domain-containing protein [Gemmatimonadaceae bacterium]
MRQIKRAVRGGLFVVALLAIVLPLAAIDPPPLSVAVHDINPGTSVVRSACLSVPVGRYAAVECGDLRVTQALPATMTMNKERAPGLTYLSRHAIPGGLLAVDVTVDSTINPGSIHLIMTIPGKDTITRLITWNSAWRSSNPRRVVLPIDALAKSITTGVYPYTLQVRAITGGDTTNTASVSDTLVIVDRSTSTFGKGWWLQGLEQLNDNTPDSTLKLWIGGDGSTRVYTKQNDSIFTVVPTVDRPDTLKRTTVEGTTTWKRRLGNNVYVEFNNTGQHTKTVNDLGHVTRFVYASGALDSIVLPVPGGSNAVPAYRFAYSTVSGSPMLDTVHAPKNPAMSHRRVVVARTNRVPTAFSGTDLTSVSITANTTTGLVSGGTQSSLTVTYSSANLITDVAVSSMQDLAFCPVEGASLLSCASTPPFSSAASSKVDGPREDVADTTRFWHSRFGGASKVRNALGDTVVILRENGTFPLLVTKTIQPNGFTQRTHYTSRGLPDSVIAVNPFGVSATAATLYAYHGTFNRVTEITTPTGDVTTMSYDGNGLLSYQQDGRGSSTRTDFILDGANRVEYIEPPGHNSGQRHHIEYDTYLGNVNKTTTPLGFVTLIARDTIGRVKSVVSQIDSNPASENKNLREYTYDAWNRVTKTDDQAHNGSYHPTYSFSSISGTSATTRLITNNTFDNEGNQTQVQQISISGSNTDTLTHTYTFNVLGQSTGNVSAGLTTTITRNEGGNMTALLTVGDSTTHDQTFTYDALNRMLERRTASKTYTATGSPPSTLLKNGTTFQYFGVLFPAFVNSIVSPADTARFTYDVNGNMLTADNYDARIKRSYYPNGQIKTDTAKIRTYAVTGTPDNDFTSHIYGIKYEYDLSGRRTSMQFPTNLGHGCTPGSSVDCIQTYHYLQHVGSVDTITSFLGHDYTFSYNDKSEMSARTAPGGVTLDFTRDLDGRLTRRFEQRGVGLGGAATVHLDSLWRTATGQIKKAKVGGIDQFQVNQFSYNRNGFLNASEFDRTNSPTNTVAQIDTSNGIGGVKNSITNRSGITVTTENTYDATSRLVKQRFVEHGLPAPWKTTVVDFNNKLGPYVIKSALERATEEAEPDTFSYTGKGYESWAWHALDGRLRAFQRVGQDTTPETRFVFEEYRYDALGRRVMLRSQTRTGCSASFCKQAMERYVWDGNQLLFEIRVPGDSGLSNAALEADTSTVSAHYGRISYVHGPGIDAPLGLTRNGVTITPNANYRGFYDAAVDTAGNNYTTNITFVPREKDPAMDAQLPRSVSGWAGSLLRAGQDQSGLLYRRNRQYDPSTGRFTQVDPIGLRGGVSLYGYASADPINRNDPFGLDDDYDYDSGFDIDADATCPEGYLESWVGRGSGTVVKRCYPPKTGQTEYAKCLAQWNPDLTQAVIIALAAGGGAATGGWPGFWLGLSGTYSWMAHDACHGLPGDTDL